MTIYGLGLLAACFLAGQLIGEVLGRLIGIDANVGGVGFAMILLILANDKLQRKDLMPAATQQGILFCHFSQAQLANEQKASQALELKSLKPGKHTALIKRVFFFLRMVNTEGATFFKWFGDFSSSARLALIGGLCCAWLK